MRKIDDIIRLNNNLIEFVENPENELVEEEIINLTYDMRNISKKLRELAKIVD